MVVGPITHECIALLAGGAVIPEGASDFCVLINNIIISWVERLQSYSESSGLVLHLQKVGLYIVKRVQDVVHIHGVIHKILVGLFAPAGPD